MWHFFNRFESIYHWGIQWAMCFYGRCSNIFICIPCSSPRHFEGCLLYLSFSLHLRLLEFLVRDVILTDTFLFILPGWSSWIDIPGFTSCHGSCCVLEWIFIPAEPSSFLLVLDCEYALLSS